MRFSFCISLLLFLFAQIGNGQAQTVVLQQNGKVRICKGTLTDTDAGKIKGDYDHNENSTLTLCVPGAKSITLKFKSFCTEKDNDVLRIFDGNDTFATLIGRYTGTKGPGTIVSKDSCITLHFISDKSVACTGWEAEIVTQIIPPVAPVISMFQTAKCNEDFIIINTNKAVPCDSFQTQNISLGGPIGITATSISALNCSGGTATRFKINLSGKLTLNGSYNGTIISYYKDFCDSIYTLTSKWSFSVSDCPLTVILKADSDTLCKNSCTWLRATVSGGNPSKYIYTWTPSGLSGAGPHRICPGSNTRYILRVTDGISIPSSDTVDIVVLDPPKAMNDTDVCYYSGNFNLRATPAGGKWYGKGVVNTNTGEYKPNGNYGVNKVWYQIGSCADTVLVNVTQPWNLENQFCPGTAARAVWWYGPAGGTWSGPKITSSGIFNPDVPGIYKDTYTWKGCISVKTILVEDIVVKRFDTTCESRKLDTLTFSPKGIYPTYFPGLINSYYGTINPNAMGGAGTKTIIWNGGGCKDTTYLTILPIYAGKTDTFCPSAGLRVLSGFRPTTNYTWTGKGIVNPSTADYDPSFFAGLGKSTYTDTLKISSSVCSDIKYIHLIPTQIKKKDTMFFCFEDPVRVLTSTLLNLVPAGGTWSGPGISSGNQFLAANAGYGAHILVYSKNGCSDSFVVFVRPKPIVQTDTVVCISSSAFRCYNGQTGGTFSGKGITNAALGIFNPGVAGNGIHTIVYKSAQGCLSSFKISVDTIPNVYITNGDVNFCYRDTAILLNANLPGGIFSGTGVVGNVFTPSSAGSGNHKILYTYAGGACTTNASINITVLDTLKVAANPGIDTICPGETVWLRSKGFGGDASSYSYYWSNGQKGSGTFVSPLSSQKFIVTLNDGCSNTAYDTVSIFKHNRPYFNVQTSIPLCFGLNGYAKVQMKANDPYQYFWDISPPYSGDSLVAPVGNTYRLTATNLRTGCQSDTQILIPGYSAIQAGFIVNIAGGEPCVTNISPTIRFFNASIGGTSGTWYWGDGTTEAFDPNSSTSHTYNGDLNKYKIKLVIYNAGGCKDSAEKEICFRDTVIVFVPTAFTPDNDNFNDQFTAVASGARKFNLSIYNRWGEKIFESEDPNQAWDGTYKGKPCAEGVYAYRVTYKGKKTGMKQVAGSVLLFRNK